MASVQTKIEDHSQAAERSLKPLEIRVTFFLALQSKLIISLYNLL